MAFIANFAQSVSVAKIWKSVNVWRRSWRKYGAVFWFTIV